MLELQDHRCPGKIERFAQAVLDVPLERVIGELRVVRKEGEAGWRGPGLRHVVDPKGTRALADGVTELAHLGEYAIEFAGGDLLCVVAPGGLDGLEDTGDLGAGERADTQYRCVRDESETILQLVVDLLAPLGVVDQIPLVEKDDQRAAALGRETRDTLVLVGDTFCRVDDE